MQNMPMRPERKAQHFEMLLNKNITAWTTMTYWVIEAARPRIWSRKLPVCMGKDLA